MNEYFCKMDNFPTPDFWYTVTVLFPSELKNEKILENNLSHIFSNFQDYLEKYNQFELEKKLLDRLEFDSQRAKQTKIIEKCEFLMKSAEKKLNEGISPWYWQLYKDVDEFIDGIHIKADYMLVLCKNI